MSKIKRKTPGVITFKPKSNLPSGVSREETEVFNAIQLQFPHKIIQRSNRKILEGKELDIYIPENRLAIEFDGVYFHSTAKKDNSLYHLWKTIECEKRGIRLLHILSDEWELKKPLVLDIINKALGKYFIISADKCILQEISPKEEEVFLMSNHLNGPLKNSSLCIALFYDNSCVFTASFLKKDNKWILGRIASKKKFLVENALKKVINYFQENFSKEPLYALIDRRFESSSELKSVGFKEIEPSNPRATYTKDFQHRYKESDFKNFDEKILLKEGWQKIYDCGKRRFILNTN